MCKSGIQILFKRWYWDKREQTFEVLYTYIFFINKNGCVGPITKSHMKDCSFLHIRIQKNKIGMQKIFRKDFLWASYYNCSVLPNINRNKDFMSGHVSNIYITHDFRFGTDEIGRDEIGKGEIWTIYLGSPKFHLSQFYPHQT